MRDDRNASRLWGKRFVVPRRSAIACSATAGALAPRIFASVTPLDFKVAKSSSSHPACIQTRSLSFRARDNAPAGSTQPTMTSESSRSAAIESRLQSNREKQGALAWAATTLSDGSVAEKTATSGEVACQVRRTFIEDWNS